MYYLSKTAVIKQKRFESSGDIQLIHYHKMTKRFPFPCLHLFDSSYTSPLHQRVKRYTNTPTSRKNRFHDFLVLCFLGQKFEARQVFDASNKKFGIASNLLTRFMD